MRAIRLLLPVLGAAAATLAAPAPADACSVCGCGDPLVDASDSVSYLTPLRLALDFEYLTANAASDDTPGATETLDQVTIRPVVVYSPTESLNLVLQVPLVRKDWAMADERARVEGLGDVDLGVRWFFLQTKSFQSMSRQALGVIAGATLPTGPSDATMDGMRLDDHAQVGTGAFGPYAGLAYAYHRDPWNLFASVTGRVRTTNSHEYHYGSALQFTVRGDYRVIDELALELGVDGRIAATDTLADEEQTNTGGFVLAAAPGVAANVWGDVWLRGRVQLPFVKDLHGEQDVGPTFFVSAQVLVR